MLFRSNKDANSPDYLTANLSGVYGNADSRTYPLSSYSYMIIPTALEGSFTENKGLTLADFASYFLCEGQQQAEVLGYSPLPVNLASAGLDQIQKIPGGNPKNKDVSTCNNPTFSSDGSNKLADTAPQPQACDKKGADQCLTGTGGAADTATATSSTSAEVVGSAVGPSSTNSAGSAGSPVLTLKGTPVGLTTGGNPVVAGAPVDLPSRGIPLPAFLLMLIAAVAALLAVLLPPVFARQRAAALAGAPRGPTKRRVTITKPLAGLRRRIAIPKVNLRFAFRKGGSAVPPRGGS